MVWPIEKLDTLTAVAAAGIHIPVADLPGVEAAEMDTTTSERKIAYAVANQFYDTVNALAAKLGFAVTKANPAAVGIDTVNQNFSVVHTFMADQEANSLSVLPLPLGNTGLVTLDSVFPGAAIVAAAATPGKGIVVNNTLIASFGGAVPADVNAADARAWLAALYYGMVASLDVAPALIANTIGNAVGIAPPANTGVFAADLPKRKFYNLTMALTIQLLLNQTTQTFDVNE